MGVWVAYDRWLAWEKFLLLGAGLVLAHGIHLLRLHYGRRALGAVGLVCSVCALVLGALLLVPFLAYSSDLVAGGLVVLLPLGVGGAVRLWQDDQRGAAAFSGLLLLSAFGVLLMTGERTAWLSLMAGGLVGIALYGAVGRSGERLRRNPRLALMVVIGIAGAIVVLVVLVIFLFMDWLGPGFAADDSIGSRLQLWQAALVLIEDGFFTGHGLNVTPMVFATYIMLSHVPLHAHVHSLYLQVAIEQGVPGLLAFLGVVATALLALSRGWRRYGGQPMVVCTTVALAAMLVHGLVDSELYAGGLVPCLFLPLGFAWALGGMGETERSAERGMPRARWRIAALTGAPIAIALLAGAAAPGVRAMFYANLGVVAQTRAELSVYSWPEWPIQDEIRRSNVVNLNVAMARYQQALALDIGNVVAHRRLAQIMLAFQEYQTAQYHLEMALARPGNQQVTRRLLGEVYAVNGAVERAVELWRTSGVSMEDLERRHWWYSFIGAEDEAHNFTRAMTLFTAMQATTGHTQN